MIGDKWKRSERKQGEVQLNYLLSPHARSHAHSRVHRVGLPPSSISCMLTYILRGWCLPLSLDLHLNLQTSPLVIMFIRVNNVQHYVHNEPDVRVFRLIILLRRPKRTAANLAHSHLCDLNISSFREFV